MQCEHLPLYMVSIANATCILVIYAVTLASLLVAAACGTDEGLKDHVTNRVTLTLSTVVWKIGPS